MEQEAFVKDLLITWQMTECKPAATPGDPASIELSLELPEEDIDGSGVWKAQKLAGSLIWLSTRTRPDIAYAQSRISSMATTAPKQALVEGKRLPRYLKGTQCVGIWLKPTEVGNVTAFGDASFAIKKSQTVRC